MKKEDILKALKDLAKSQGFYGRLLAQIESVGAEMKYEYLDFLERQNFKDAVDLILYFET